MKTGKDDMPQQSEIYYNHLESQFDSTDGTNAILIMKLLKLDDEHGDQNIIEAVRYLVDKDCRPEGDAPTNFLTDNEVSAINRDGKFRPKLYSMLLASKVADGISNKTLFFPDSYKYAWENDSN